MAVKVTKVISMALAASILLSTTAGCSKDASSTPATQGAKTTAQASSKPDQKAKITYAVWDYSVSPEYKEIIEAFQKENPNITVEPLEISSKEYNDKLTIMLAGGDNTDTYSVKDMPSYAGFVMKNQITALDDMIEKDKVDLKSYAGVVDNIKFNNKLYELPYRSDFWILYYNKDIFDKAKVAYPTEDMTFDQFREMAKKLTSGTGNDKVFGTYVHNWKSCIMNWAVADGKGTLINGKYDFTKPAYQLFLPMQNEDKSFMDYATAKLSNAHYKGQFESGKVGMMLMGTWFVGTLISDKKDGKHNVNWGITKAPHFAGAKAGTTFGNVTGNAINPKSKNLDATWKFVKFMGTEGGAKVLAKRGLMPAYRNQEVLDLFSKVEGFPAEGKKALETSSVALEFPPNKNGAAIDKALQEEHELIMIGKNDLDKGIAAMNKRVQEIMAGN